MRHRLAILAITAAASSLAYADTTIGPITIYGKVDVSYDEIKTGSATDGTAGVTQGRVASNTTYIGFKGQEDFSGGLAGVWQIESTVLAGDSSENGTTNNGYLGTRNTYLGLASSRYGTILGGRYDTPYKLSTRLLDQFFDGIADNRSIMGGGTFNNSAATSFDNRQDDVIAYISPSLQGVTLIAAHTNLNVTAATASSTQNKSATSLAAWYSANNIYATIAYEAHDNLGTLSGSPATEENESATKIGLGYTLASVFSLAGEYEKTSDNQGANNTDRYGHHAFYVGGRYYLAPTYYFKAAYTQAGSEASAANTGAKQLSLGFDHDLSSTTAAYVLYSRIDNQSAATYSFANVSSAGLGAPVNESTTSSTLTGPGASPTVVAVGLRKTF
jgi:predicted porin